MKLNWQTEAKKKRREKSERIRNNWTPFQGHIDVINLSERSLSAKTMSQNFEPHSRYQTASLFIVLFTFFLRYFTTVVFDSFSSLVLVTTIKKELKEEDHRMVIFEADGFMEPQFMVYWTRFLAAAEAFHWYCIYFPCFSCSYFFIEDLCDRDGEREG